MLYHIDTEERTAGGRRGTVYHLSHNGTGMSAEVWPAHGFNCLRWQVPSSQGPKDALYLAPDWNTNPVPTRSGVPILFPFPNRLRGGHFSFAGREIQLPLNDSTAKNAIHGFSPRNPWRIVGYHADEHGARVHGEFRLCEDGGEPARLWPGDLNLSITIRLTATGLRYDITVHNLGKQDAPFGLGFHPYFRFPLAGAEEDVGGYRLHAPALHIWELVDSLPTGAKPPVPDDFNWNTPHAVSDRSLDTLYTDLDPIGQLDGPLLLCARVGHEKHKGAIEIWTIPGFRESLLFTPAHRHALAVEPYTCATDAPNLTARGLDAGWEVLQAGSRWTGAIEFRWVPEGTV